jgi:cellobiose epimerase
MTRWLLGFVRIKVVPVIEMAHSGLILLFFVLLPPSYGNGQGVPNVEPSKETYLKLADQVEAVLHRDVLDVWFPRNIDNENGGFYSGFDRKWQSTPSEGKFSVFQGRMTWISSQAAIQRPELRDKFLPIARHGIDFLNDVLWDKQYGGFFWGVDDHGKISPAFGDRKELYGESFAMYGAAAAYQATNDPKALQLAENAFHWIDSHAHDSKNGGYFEWLTREGKPLEATAEVQPSSGGFPIGYKTMNTHIHLLESFSQLYQVWKDDTLRKRLEELLTVVRDKVCVQPGVLNLYFTNDWRPLPDHDSYGHDVETAYLMLEAEDILGVPHDPKTESMARMLVDHALAYGWDKDMGGFYDEGTTFGQSENKRKEWWVEFEGLNALLLMHERYRTETSRYFDTFLKQWQFISEHQIDSEFHGVYGEIGPDGSVQNSTKGHNWKAAYHDGRALLNVTARLRKLAAETN